MLIRTDFSDQLAWDKLVAVASEPATDIFFFDMEIVDDPANNAMTVEQLMEALPEDYPHGFMVVADSIAVSQPDYPLLIVDLSGEPGRQFRAIAAEVSPIENNLSIGNMDFEEFAGLVG